MLRLPPFKFCMPETLAETTRILAGEGPRARLVAGGTDLWPNMKRRHQSAETVVSLMKQPELSGFRSLDRDLRIGATTSLSAVIAQGQVRERFPSLASAVASISSPPLRNMGTLGGNLCLDTRCTYYNQTEEWRQSIDYCMKEAGSVCWVAPSSPRCWAHSASDSAPVLCALNASVKLVSADGDRVIPVSDLFRDDGIEYLALEPGEILTEIIIPSASDAANCRSAFWKLRRRGSIDFAVLSVAASVWLDDGQRVRAGRIYLGAVGSRPLQVAGSEELMIGKELDEEMIVSVAALARKTATPMDNTDFQAQWRGKMAEFYTRAVLHRVAGLESGFSPPNHPLFEVRGSLGHGTIC